jgi:hypothetical protein
MPKNGNQKHLRIEGVFGDGTNLVISSTIEPHPGE